MLDEELSGNVGDVNTFALFCHVGSLRSNVSAAILSAPATPAPVHMRMASPTPADRARTYLCCRGERRKCSSVRTFVLSVITYAFECRLGQWHWCVFECRLGQWHWHARRVGCGHERVFKYSVGVWTTSARSVLSEMALVVENTWPDHGWIGLYEQISRKFLS